MSTVPEIRWHLSIDTLIANQLDMFIVKLCLLLSVFFIIAMEVHIPIDIDDNKLRQIGAYTSVNFLVCHAVYSILCIIKTCL